MTGSANHIGVNLDKIKQMPEENRVAVYIHKPVFFRHLPGQKIIPGINWVL
jgi:hypothetical protein